MFGLRTRRARGTTTPTLTSGTGAFTTASAALAYTLDGSRMPFNCTVTITTNGTAATDIEFTLPYTPFANTALSAIDSAGLALAALAKTDGKVYVTKYDGSYPGASLKTIYVAGAVRLA